VKYVKRFWYTTP